MKQPYCLYYQNTLNCLSFLHIRTICRIFVGRNSRGWCGFALIDITYSTCVVACIFIIKPSSSRSCRLIFFCFLSNTPLPRLDYGNLLLPLQQNQALLLLLLPRLVRIGGTEKKGLFLIYICCIPPFYPVHTIFKSFQIFK